MKKNIILISAWLAIAPLVQAQSGNVFSVEAGYTNPKDAKGGVFAGLMIGRALDQSVNVSLGVDYFKKSYSEESVVATQNEQGLTSNTYTTAVDYNRTIIPINLVMDARIPTSRYFGYFIRGGLSYQLLFSEETNYELDQKETRRFRGLGWIGAAGFFYHIGRRSTLMMGATYNSCEVSRDIEQSEQGLPISERVDLSGIGFRLGVSLDL